MVTPELLAYVQEQKKAGLSDDQLRQALSAQGWFGEDINAALNPSTVPSTSLPVGNGMQTELPLEARGWSWGAAGLTWIWGIKFSVWLSFITFVLNGIWWVVLGIKGREWAWKAKHWKSVDEFKAAMQPWDRWGLILFIVGLSGGIAFGIFYTFIFSSVANNVSAT